jgi:predicted translin family RNA/ssDNA-binding protein
MTHPEFQALNDELHAQDEAREALIADSRSLQRLAKAIIYTLHRGQDAAKDISDADAIASRLKAAYVHDYRLKSGAVTAALQEWAEAKAYHTYVTKRVLLSKKETGLETEDYLLGLMDLSGELVRKAVTASVDRDRAEVMKIRVFLDELYGGLLSFDFRNGELRKKTDAVRWNLQKVEELLVKGAGTDE